MLLGRDSELLPTDRPGAARARPADQRWYLPDRILRSSCWRGVDRSPPAGSTIGHQAHVTLQCDCGEILAFSGTSAIVTCRCGAAYGALVHDIHYREEHLRNEDVHPWHYDLHSRQEDQHQRDEAAYPEGSSWRYDEVTSGLEDEKRWKKA